MTEDIPREGILFFEFEYEKEIKIFFRETLIPFVKEKNKENPGGKIDESEVRDFYIDYLRGLKPREAGRIDIGLLPEMVKTESAYYKKDWRDKDLIEAIKSAADMIAAGIV